MSRDLTPDEVALDLAGYHRGHARGYIEGLAAGKQQARRAALDEAIEAITDYDTSSAIIELLERLRDRT